MKRKYLLLIFVFLLILISTNTVFAKYIFCDELNFGKTNILQEFNVSFDPMAIGQLKSSDVQRKVIKGNAVGTLPTPLVRPGYTFLGYYENLLNLKQMESYCSHQAKDISVSNEELSVTATGTDMYIGEAFTTHTPQPKYKTEYGQLIEIDSSKDLSFYITNPSFNKNYFTFWDKDFNCVRAGSEWFANYGSNSGTIKAEKIPSNAKYVTFRLGVCPSTSGKTYKTKIILKRGGIPKTWVSYNKQLQPTDIITSDTEYFGRYTKNTYNLTVKSQNAHGTISGESSGKKEYSEQMTVTATPKTGYKFIGWSDGTNIVSTNTSYTFNMPAKDYQLVANFILSSVENGEIVPYDDNITFIVVKGTKTWKDAESYAQTLGGHLARIDSKEKNDLLCSKIQSIGRTWFGLTDEEKEGTWKWCWGGDIAGYSSVSNGKITLSGWNYQNWNNNEPNNSTSTDSEHINGENYAHIIIETGKWNDYGNNNSQATGFIVEIHNNE